MIAAPQHPWFKESRKDLIVLRLPAKPTNDQVHDCTDAMGQYISSTRKASPWVVDLSDLQEISAAQRKAFADHERNVAKLSTMYVQRMAYVVATPLIRAALTAYFWIWQPTYPYRVFSLRTAAEKWALGLE